MFNFNLQMGIKEGMLVTESLLTEETAPGPDGEVLSLWATGLVDNSILLDEVEAAFTKVGYKVIRCARTEIGSTLATYEWLCVGLFGATKPTTSWNPEYDTPSEADCLAAMYADEAGRMHP